jgi:hypothetical protein
MKVTVTQVNFQAPGSTKQSYPQIQHTNTVVDVDPTQPLDGGALFNRLTAMIPAEAKNNLMVLRLQHNKKTLDPSKSATDNGVPAGATLELHVMHNDIPVTPANQTAFFSRFAKRV